MPTIKATGRIRIREDVVPKGDAPIQIRKAWQGLELPCHPICGYPDNNQPMERSVLTNTPEARNRYGYSVPQKDAIEALRKANKLYAVDWFVSRDFPRKDECFCFGEDEAIILSGVTRQQIRNNGDDIPGGPDR